MLYSALYIMLDNNVEHGVCVYCGTYVIKFSFIGNA